MDALDSPHISHRKRLRKIQADALGAIVGICTSLLSIYWTVTYGLPFKAYFLDGVARAVVILTGFIYIFAQFLALKSCFLRKELSALKLEKDLNGQMLLRHNKKSAEE